MRASSSRVVELWWLVEAVRVLVSGACVCLLGFETAAQVNDSCPATVSNCPLLLTHGCRCSCTYMHAGDARSSVLSFWHKFVEPFFGRGQRAYTPLHTKTEMQQLEAEDHQDKQSSSSDEAEEGGAGAGAKGACCVVCVVCVWQRG